MTRLYMLIVTISALGSAMVYAACGVPVGTASCTVGTADYPACKGSNPVSNNCGGSDPTHECSYESKKCDFVDLVPDYVKKNCVAKKNAFGDNVYSYYDSYGSSATPCGG